MPIMDPIESEEPEAVGDSVAVDPAAGESEAVGDWVAVSREDEDSVAVDPAAEAVVSDGSTGKFAWL